MLLDYVLPVQPYSTTCTSASSTKLNGLMTTLSIRSE
jgi:hypothetical protein